MSYATQAEVLNVLGNATATGSDLLARVDAARAAASDQIEHDTGRVFAASTAARTFRAGPHRDLLMLPDFTAVTALKFDDDDDGVFETTVSASSYELDRWSDRADWPWEVIRLLDRYLPCGGRRQRRVEVTATWGWSAVPSAVSQACALQAARWAQRGPEALFGVQAFGESGVGDIRTLDPDVQVMLRPFVKPKVA